MTRDQPKPTVGFHERYASDTEFKRQVDDAKKRSNAARGTAALKKSLAMVSERKKSY